MANTFWKKNQGVDVVLPWILENILQLLLKPKNTKMLCCLKQ